MCAVVPTIPEGVEELLREATDVAVQSGRPLEQWRGTAIYDSSRDALLKEIPAFVQVVALLASRPQVTERYGADNAERLALQLVYEFFSNLTSLEWRDEAAQAVWTNFLVEEQQPL